MLRSLVLCFFASLLVGCGGSADDAPDVVPVKGKVLVDGKPLSAGTIDFYPDEAQGTKGPGATGEISPTGEFTMISPGNREGSMVGHFKVTITCPFDPGGGSSPSGELKVPEGSVQCELPAKYSEYENTPLTVEVKAEGNEDLVIEVTSN
jgi:hypothetical protein